MFGYIAFIIIILVMLIVVLKWISIQEQELEDLTERLDRAADPLKALLAEMDKEKDN
jgi:uncharacterized membrane protein